ncbi:MAG: hypothetical protein ACFCBW_14880 [Candidatus Competibacterales bacterium]
MIIATLPLAFFADADPEGLGLIPSQIAPGLVVLFIWVLPFDMLLAKIFMGDQPEAERWRGRTIIRLDQLLLVALLLCWGPFFLEILGAVL